jgi:phenylacetate-CoA ligase
VTLKPAADYACPADLLDPLETASRDEIASIQLDRLKVTLDRVWANVPYYRDKFEAHGVSPDDLKSLDDLAKFPFTVKDDLRATYPFGLFAVPREQVVRIHASSGTTGKPTVVGYTRNDVAMWAEVVARSMRAAGTRPGDIVHVAYGYGLFTGGLGAHYGAERLGCTVIPMSGGQSARQIQMIEDLKPRVIMVTPSYMLNLLDEMDRMGLHPRDNSLEIGIFGAEPWTQDIRAAIESRAHMHAVDIYGLSEVIGPGVANECIETKDGLHVWEDHFYPEIIDPETGKALPDGEFGELVFTSLTKEALPVIRYRTRDLTRLLPGTARSMRRIEKITGRSDDMLIIRGVNVFPTQIEELVVRAGVLAPHYQLELYKVGPMDALRAHVEIDVAADTAEEARAAAARLLARAAKDMIGISIEVLCHPPGGVPRSEGKAQRIVDRRKG